MLHWELRNKTCTRNFVLPYGRVARRPASAAAAISQELRGCLRVHSLPALPPVSPLQWSVFSGPKVVKDHKCLLWEQNRRWSVVSSPKRGWAGCQLSSDRCKMSWRDEKQRGTTWVFPACFALALVLRLSHRWIKGKAYFYLLYVLQENLRAEILIDSECSPQENSLSFVVPIRFPTPYGTN